MNVGAEEKRKRLIAIGLGSVAALLVGYQLLSAFGGGTITTPPPPVIVTASSPTAKGARMSGPAAQKLSSSSQLDPTLHMEAMLVTESLVYSGMGRNIFSGEAEAPLVKIAETKMPQPAFGPRPKPPEPCPPNCPPPPAPVVAPVPFKFFGTDTATARDIRRAFLLSTQGDDVFVATVGDIVQRRYRVVSIAANEIVIEDIPNANKQSLPLVK